ncbi:MAG TPA: hypothetical protein VK550_23340 [Polyangiaceae bacterium]|nr:hypothetical protein [Polyangiaceae bacterium]
MSRQYVGWVAVSLLAAAWLESCGAMTIEPAMPDEPVVAPASAPRLVRRDAAVDAMANRQDDRD